MRSPAGVLMRLCFSRCSIVKNDGKSLLRAEQLSPTAKQRRKRVVGGGQSENGPGLSERKFLPT